MTCVLFSSRVVRLEIQKCLTVWNANEMAFPSIDQSLGQAKGKVWTPNHCEMKTVHINDVFSIAISSLDDPAAQSTKRADDIFFLPFLFFFFLLWISNFFSFSYPSFPMPDVSESTIFQKSVPIPHICVPPGTLHLLRCDSQYYFVVLILCSNTFSSLFFSLSNFFELTQFPSIAVRRPSVRRCHPRPSMTAPCCPSPCPLGYTRRCPTTRHR